MDAQDAELAAVLAGEAGQLLLELRERTGLTGRELGDAGDAAANTLLVESLRDIRPDDGILSEESADGPERLRMDRVWIIDPLDGTREYGEGRSDWAVHVALSIGGRAAIGAVALPGVPGSPVLRSDFPAVLPPLPDVPRMVVSRTRPAAEAAAVAEILGADCVPMGSAGAKAMAIVRGEAEIYLHSGGQHEWDNCAPVAVAAAHGLHCSRIDGSAMRYNNADTRIPDLLICRLDYAERVLALVAREAEEEPIS
ncbi:3'(2'),5'-bisphosphate nucleotidase CysQ [Altererythrobacter sp. SALINAS58]|uniref:3'(2'),5'-bisphosphate nucleotidase CysQ n=1 Tax=Alteripontixanthobacter muriae TaxID=2705546 RepID=UPI001576023F|nr:3'(2'),5'-bisphosphate nucleotidase CysQ [Alteripontixanthobacter muriae]NTZ43435.1 3'(2'),5'-bisphosphate nucleotidase CysQ [Alteripontixanthobacter muriae]